MGPQGRSELAISLACYSVAAIALVLGMWIAASPLQSGSGAIGFAVAEQSR